MSVKTMVLIAALILTSHRPANPDARTKEWTVQLHSEDFLVGQQLEELTSRHQWRWQFNDGPFEGQFDVAVRKSAMPILAPKCRMEYLILTMAYAYPEAGKKATVAERRAVYNALLEIKKTGQGSLIVHFEVDPSEVHYGASGPELAMCNTFFVLPLASDAAKILP